MSDTTITPPPFSVGSVDGEDVFEPLAAGGVDTLSRVEFTYATAPGFHTCPKCGERTMGPALCFDCVKQREVGEKLAEAARVTLRTIPESYRWATLGDERLKLYVRDDTARTEVKRWLNSVCRDASWRLTLVGAAGAGKTSLACAVLRELGGSGLFMHAYRLGVARGQHRMGDGEPAAVEAAMRTPLLLLDDVGSERQTQTNAVADVIVERHAEGKRTIVTTGLSAAQFATMYGGGCARRVFQGATIVNVASKKGLPEHLSSETHQER